VAGGRGFMVDMDLEKFFDRVNHDMLMVRVARKVGDKRVLRLIRRYLQAGLMLGGIETARSEGTPQGGRLSPLLSNILLDDLDKELERRGHAFCRYADDCNIYVVSRRAGERVMASLTRFLSKRLRLTINAAKSAVDRPWRRAYLGCSAGSPRSTPGSGQQRSRPLAQLHGQTHDRRLPTRLLRRSRPAIAPDGAPTPQSHRMNRRIRNRTSGGVGGRQG
jgi:Reverse transcriptase (RNA-dependent DNA polymerase)